MAILNAIIENKGNTLIIDFPHSIYDVYEKLLSIGIRKSPNEIMLTDNEDDDIQVKLYSDSDFGNHVIDFSCGGTGFGPSTQYYGFFYSATDDLTAWNGGVCPADELYEFGDGYKYQQADGDNEYYVEEIGEHFFTMRRVFEKL